MNIWNWLSGKKTVIGASAGTIAMGVQAVGDIWGVEGPWLGKTVKTLLYVSGAFGVPGLAHKWIKSKG